MKMIAQLPDHLFSMAAQLFDLGYKDVADETTNLIDPVFLTGCLFIDFLTRGTQLTLST